MAEGSWAMSLGPRAMGLEASGIIIVRGWYVVLLDAKPNLQAESLGFLFQSDAQRPPPPPLLTRRAHKHKHEHTGCLSALCCRRAAFIAVAQSEDVRRCASEAAPPLEVRIDKEV